MSKQLVIIGAGGHGKVVSDIAALTGYDRIAFLDDNEKLDTCNGYPVVGRVCDYTHYKDSDFSVAIGNGTVRSALLEKLQRDNMTIATLIHPNAVVANSVSIGVGTVVMAGAIINAESRIGKGCIINTAASVDHECVLSDYVHISAGTHLAGNVQVGKSTWLGIGAVVSNNLSICADSIIGAGAVVVQSITEKGTYIGVPAKKMMNNDGI